MKVCQRLLKALGYLSTYDRSPEVDEQIQMRADKLYHRMLDQEGAVEKVNAEGLPVPQFVPLIDQQKQQQQQQTTPKATGISVEVAQPGPEKIKEWQEKLEKLPEEDRAAEQEALKAEHRARAEMAAQIQTIWQEQAKEREARKAEGKETIMDRVKGILGK